jgi:nucleotide-binding universal stress UspA family protein
MAVKDILLVLTSYPEPTPVSVIKKAIAIASALGAHLAALSCEVFVELPGHFMSGSVVGLPGIIAGEAAKSRKNAQELIAAFDAEAARAGVSCQSNDLRCNSSELSRLLVDYARLRDLTIMPESDDRWYAEAVIFGSGRPTLILPRNPRSATFALGTVVVAWDFSRAAARAVADSLPLLERAANVRVVCVLNEKRLDRKLSAEDLSGNLSRHGVDVTLDQIDAKGRAIGEVLESYVAAHAADLLVMGAYGHSRLREFVLGGATRSLLSKPPLPILFSH